MKKDHKMFVDTRPVLGRQEDFDLKRLKDIYRDLSEYLRMPIEEISRTYWDRRETTDRRQQKLIENASSEEKLIEYYRNTIQYLYELSVWEAQKDKQREFKKIYLFCRKFNIKKILDFGGGVGGLCIYLKNRGLSCDYLDIPGKTYDFAMWRFNRYRIELKAIGAFENSLSLNYDAVVGYDVFEHIFDLPATIEKINSCLIIGGYLISISTFGGGGLHLLKNELYQKFENFNGLLSKKGFRFVGQLKIDRFSSLLNEIGFKYMSFSIRLNKKPKHGGNLIVHKKIANLID